QQAIQATGWRSTPDVAFESDPSTGVAVYKTSAVTGQGSWQVAGGTSVAAPAWAGIIAIADQGRALAGRGSLSGATQTLPTLYALTATDFHTVPGSSASQTPPWGGWWGGGGSSGGGSGWWTGDNNGGAGATANTSTGLGS